MENRKKTYKMAILALFIAIEIILVLTPLGIIPIGPIQITTMHIPVVLAAILLGTKQGAILGLVFGLASTTYAVVFPSPASLFFTPFYSIGEYSGNFFSLVIAIVPRVLLGVIAGSLYGLLSKTNVPKGLAIIISSVVSTVIHTVMVMSLIYIFFGRQYSALFNVQLSDIMIFVWLTLATNGFYEALFAGFLNWPIIRALQKVIREER
ncbi:MAG TPA: ECF transporter S component [Erysipelotrichaceae bacterium]|nr:ECF transporter S component [Erysipelotrichaceae bacterium]HQB32262.1 ECF transporter S component [Erysipelotrichaceae bacterium]